MLELNFVGSVEPQRRLQTRTYYDFHCAKNELMRNNHYTLALKPVIVQCINITLEDLNKHQHY